MQDLCQMEMANAKIKYINNYYQNADKSNESFKFTKSLYTYFSQNLLLAISTLTIFEIEILEREFFWYTAEKKWYEEFCSKTTYYKRRNEMASKIMKFYFEKE